MYKAPNCSTNAFFAYLDDVLRSELRQGKEFIITGDINSNLLDESLPQTQRAIEFMDVNQLSQLISKPTRISSGSVSLIDVIITSAPQLFSKTGVLRNSLSDHFSIFGVIPLMKH